MAFPNLDLFLNLLALFFCSVAVYAWDEVYGITKRGRVSGGWIYLIIATVFAVAGIYPAVASFFYEIGPDFERYWVVVSKVLEGVFLMVAGVVFYNTIYRSLRTQPIAARATPTPAEEKGAPAAPPSSSDEDEFEIRYGVGSDQFIRGLLARLSLYWGPDVSRQLLIQSLQGRVDERQMLRLIADFLPLSDEEKWRQKWIH